MKRTRRLCFTVLCALVLSACATGVRRSAEPHADPSPDAASTPATGTGEAGSLASPPTQEPIDPGAGAAAQASAPEQLDFWQSIAAGFAFAQCDAPDTRRMISVYRARPESFTNNLRRALPQLGYVAQAVQAHALPGEFVLLPLVESDYASHAVRGSAAGIWQLMPATAREQGLRVDRDYDGRFDLGGSTRTAMRLLARLHDQFPQDWRLVDMAYNAGHYRVAMAMAVLERRGLPVEPAVLDLPRITREHVAKLEALACIVRDPQVHGVQLPQELPASERLVAVPAPPGLSFELVLRLARIEYERLRSLNRGFLKGRVPNTAGHEIVLPAAQATRLSQGLALMAPGQAASFGYAKLSQSSTWDSLARSAQLPADLLAGINGVRPDAPVRDGARLFLPSAALTGLAASRLPDRDAVRSGGALVSTERVTIRNGDTLWDLAARHGTTVAQLQQLNGLSATSVLRPGKQLRLRASDAAGLGGLGGASR